MNLDNVDLWTPQEFPRTLTNIKEADLLRAISQHPQGHSHRQTVSDILDHHPEVEILQQSPDFAILRSCPGAILPVAHYIVGYADDQRGLFLHNVPNGDIELGSEPLWYILQWLNRTDEGFHRVQGDLLLRDIREGWEIEAIQNKEKDMAGSNGMFLDPPNCEFIEIGNNHEIIGLVTRSTSAGNENPDPDPRVLAKTEAQKTGPQKLNVRHREHPQISRDSKKKTYREIGLQRRGRDTRHGGGD